MSRLLFALVDAWLWGQWIPTFRRRQRSRGDAMRGGDWPMVAFWGHSMRATKVHAVGVWRSLWGVL